MLVISQSQNLIRIIVQLMEEKSSIQKISQSKMAQCAFCYSQSEEIKCLLKKALMIIKPMLKQKKYSETVCKSLSLSTSSTSYLGLHRLIRILFEKQQFQIKFSKNCSHSQLRNRFMQRLECRSDQFQSAIQDLCDKLARRNYELEVISLQIKHVQNSVLQLQDSIQISTKSRKESISSQSQPFKVPSFPVKIQSVQEPNKMPPQALQRTSTVYQPYETMSCPYNLFFYGAPYY